MTAVPAASGPHRRAGGWLTRPCSIPRWLGIVIVVAAAAAAGWATHWVDTNARARTTELHSLTGVVDGVQLDGSGICIKVDDRPGECYEAVNVLNPLPKVGDRVSVIYALVPYSPNSGVSAYRIVSIEILTSR